MSRPKSTRTKKSTAPKRRRYRQTKPSGPLPVLNCHAAAVDVGSREHYVAAPGAGGEIVVRSFGCFTTDLHAMAEWLEGLGVTTVALESTGVYWIPVFEVLEDYGFEALLIDPAGMKQVKTDVRDCRDMQRLHAHGLLRGAFRPPQVVAALRAYTRQRKELVEQCSRAILLMQKALDQMNLHLHKTLSDVSGVSGQRIIRAILRGERNPNVLAQLRHASVKASEEELIKALTGHYREEHLFALGQAVEAFDFYQGQLEKLDRRLHDHLRTLPAKDPEAAPSATPAAKRRKNQFYVDLAAEHRRILGVDLRKIPSIDTLTVQTYLGEVGPDPKSAFPTEKHFASWLGLCPNNRKTGGAIRSRHTRHVKHRLATALRVAAQSLERSQTALGAFYRRMKQRLGAPKAITATAHKLARLIYRMLTKGEEYVERGMDYYETQYRQRVLNNLIKRTRQLGYQLINQETGELVS